MQRLLFAGRVTTAPDVRIAENGARFARFTVAVTAEGIGKDGGDRTDSLPCIIWADDGRFAANLSDAANGSEVKGEGAVTRWYGKGRPRSGLEIKVLRAVFKAPAKAEAADELTAEEAEALFA